MQARIKIYCNQDGMYIGIVRVDTADMPEQLQEKINKVILEHRPACYYYGLKGKANEDI